MYKIGDKVIYQGADKSAYKRRGVVASIEEKDGKPQLTVAFEDGEEFTAPIDDWSRAFTNAAPCASTNATVRNALNARTANASVCNEVKIENPNYNPVKGMKYLEKYFSVFDPKYAKAMIDDAMRKGVKIPSGLLAKAKAAGMIANAAKNAAAKNATARNYSRDTESFAVRKQLESQLEKIVQKFLSDISSVGSKANGEYRRLQKTDPENAFWVNEVVGWTDSLKEAVSESW